MELPFRHRLELANRPIEHVYFFEDGLASVVAISRRGRRQAEVGVVGYEGMSGLAVLHGVEQSPNDTFMQIAGHGRSVPAGRLRLLLGESPSLTADLMRFAHVFEVQAGGTALANAEGNIEERLSRWLLMSQDRIGSADLKLTHEFLAIMLGVRRPGVTLALQKLEARGLVTTRRGVVQIEDRASLEAAANGLYGVPEAEFERLFGPAPSSVRIRTDSLVDL